LADVRTGTYQKGSDVYERLTYAITSWAERTLLFVADHTPDDYVLPLAIDGTTGKPVGPRGALHCLVAALSVYDAYNGLVPPSWAHGGRLPQDDVVLNDHRNIGVDTTRGGISVDGMYNT